MTTHQTVLKTEICNCNGRENWRNQIQSMIANNISFAKNGIPRPPWPKGMEDEDGYWLCGWCGKIEKFMARALARCDICGKRFKGYKKYPKIDYTGPCCE